MAEETVCSGPRLNLHFVCWLLLFELVVVYALASFLDMRLF